MKNKYKLCALMVLLCLTLFLGTGCSGQPQAGTETDDTAQNAGTVPAADADGSSDAEGVTAVIEVEGYGTITVALDASAAPLTVENFVSLAQDGFYDGLTFHRIMEGFMIQGGDPEGTGYGGSGQTIKGEFLENGVENNLSHTRGVISMARSSQSYDSASSQFFIVQEDSTFLDGGYAAFGYVTGGMEVVDAICADAEPLDDNGTIASDAQPVIRSITIQ